MPNESFLRQKEGFRFKFGGMKVNDAADALPPEKYPYAQNIRGVGDDYVEVRPGAVLKFTTAGGVPITDLRAYAALFTDNLPRYLVRDNADNIYLDNGVLVGSLTGGGSTPGAVLVPFRPGASPNPYMYIANGNDYEKFSAPGVANAVTQKKVGIAEPTGGNTPNAVINSLSSSIIAESVAGSGGWTAGGTAGGVSGAAVRINDSILACFQDPAAMVGQPTMWSLAVHQPAGETYQQLMPVHINGSTQAYVIQDVFPPITTQVTIAGIYYFGATNTGRCIIVPSNMGTFTPSPQKGGPAATGGPVKGRAPSSNTRHATNNPRAQSRNIYDSQNLMSNLRRGAIIQIDAEYCLVWSITEGPDGTVAIETSTTIQHFVGGGMLAPATITVFGVAFAIGQSITAGGIVYAVNAGVGTQTTNILNNPFVDAGIFFQDDDYLSFGAYFDNLNNLIEFRLLIDVSDGSFTKDYYYYAVRPSDIQNAINNAGTIGATQLSVVQTADQRQTIDEEAYSKLTPKQQQLQGYAPSSTLQVGASVWSQIVANLNQLTRIGSDDTKSLLTMTKMQFLVYCSGTVNVQTSIVEIFGGQQLDVSDIGAPYQYVVRGRDSTTGVVGNPSPATRYGVSPRRQNVIVTFPTVPLLPTGFVDPQVDTWDVFRYGGSVTEFRFIGSIPVVNAAAGFLDNFDDDAAGAGELLDYDNFEPWPTVGLPNNSSPGFLATTVVGTVAVISSNDPFTPNYLPGTLVRFGGQNVYTLWTRPIALGGTNYLFQFYESANALTNASYQIQEPYLARQNLPYMWGVDASGTMFACGDPFRPGNCYFAKNYAPDAAPDSYNVEITPPTEPLLGGEILDGLGFVGSTERWWALYPQPDNPAQRYNFVQQPFPRGLAAPYGHCNDGVSVYWWAKDGIWSSSEGSLTDADLYSLFPHEGQVGRDSTYGTPPLSHTVKAPDYSRARTFRLAYANYFLYATYQDNTGMYNSLTYDLRRKAWVNDVYGTNAINQPTVVYHPEQQAGALNANILYDEVVMANSLGQVLTQQQYTNDNVGAISCMLPTFEYDGGDVRGLAQWGDYFVDASLNSQTGLTVQPMSLGRPVGMPQVLAVQNTRFRQPVSVGPTIVASDFMGVYFNWTDDFTTQTVPTRLFVWQPSYVIQPVPTQSWQTLGASFQGEGADLHGYKHIRQFGLSYISTATVTVTITSYDWAQPLVLTFPPTGGTLSKLFLPVPANKGLLYRFAFNSNAPFQVFSDESEIHIGAWQRNGPYAIVQKFTDSPVAGAPI